MSDTLIEQKPANPKADEWAERIAAQQSSGMSVKQFCKEHGLTEYSFYAWRKRLQEKGPLRYLLELQPEVLPKSPSGAAVRYALNQRVALTRLLEYGELEIGNGATEWANRDIALGRGNWTFFGSDGGGVAKLHRFLQAVRSRAVCLVPRRALAHPGALHNPAKRTTAAQLGTCPRRDHRFRSFG
jgi:hypothetical protein